MMNNFFYTEAKCQW